MLFNRIEVKRVGAWRLSGAGAWGLLLVVVAFKGRDGEDGELIEGAGAYIE